MRKSFTSFLVALITSTMCTAQNHKLASDIGESGYAEKIITLREFVARYAKQNVNTFFIGKAQDDDGKLYLYAFWKEDKSILILEHFHYLGKNTDFGLLHRKARVDLKTDVVPTEEDIHGSTFLVDRAWANRIIKACVSKGTKIVILKPKRSTSRA